MTDTHLTHDLCRRLRDAGLPQPEVAPRQNWYRPEASESCIILRIDKQNDLSIVFYDPEKKSFLQTIETSFDGYFIFHPTLEYLLRQLGSDAVLEYYSKHGSWEVKTTTAGEIYLFDRTQPETLPANALKAAALAYLHLHEKTQVTG